MLENLLEGHPEGLGKHILVYDYTTPSNVIGEQQILDNYSHYEIPYFIQEHVFPYRKFFVV